MMQKCKWITDLKQWRGGGMKSRWQCYLINNERNNGESSTKGLILRWRKPWPPLPTFTYLPNSAGWLEQKREIRELRLSLMNNKKEPSRKSTFLAVRHARFFLFVMLHESCDNSPPGVEHFRKVPGFQPLFSQIHGWSGLISPSIPPLLLFISVPFDQAYYLIRLSASGCSTMEPKHAFHIPENVPLFGSCFPFAVS